MARLKKYYAQEVVPMLMKEQGYTSVMRVPRLLKIVLNVGVSKASSDKKVMEHVVHDLSKISGQKPSIRYARKSVAGFKLREGQAIGCCVTLRGERMYYFLDKLISVALPRVRDFRGLSARSFDGRGNYSFGIKEQIVFSEIDYDKIDELRGMDITIVTSAASDQEAKLLLSKFSFPIKN